MKCAEAAALRTGWPEGLANVYSEDEVDRARMADYTPSAIAETARLDRNRENFRPKGTILIDLDDGNGLSPVPVGEFHDRVSALIKRYGPQRGLEILAWRDQQRICFREFFAHDRTAALDLNRQFEEIAKVQKIGAHHVS